MSALPEIPSDSSPRRVITYELTRWDLVADWMLVFLRNRILQVFLLVPMILVVGFVLGTDLPTLPSPKQIFIIGIFVSGFLGLIGVTNFILAIANVFLYKYRGIVGQHTLEITKQGLIERTNYNESLALWPSSGRIFPLCGYLYIYVSDMNYHVVPKRCFSQQDIGSFEADLRAHANQVNS